MARTRYTYSRRTGLRRNDAAEASEARNDAAEASEARNDAAEASISRNDAAEASQSTYLLEPKKFHFSSDNFVQTCKIGTRCELYRTVGYLKDILTNNELRWFKNHPQFGHFFHMELETNHKLMGLWTLLLRKVVTAKKNEAWFVLNGVPIRYSMKEHALITGFDCKPYPEDYQDIGSLAFVQQHFKRQSKIDQSHIKEVLSKMRQGTERIKMALLYFLGTVIKANKKTRHGYLDSFLLRAVDRLDKCLTFPWGRLTFEENIKEINHMMAHFNGSLQGSWTIPGFILPLEVLVFESVPKLDDHFRENVLGASIDCPRMCRRRFKSLMSKGFRLDDVYEVLDTTKV